MYHARPVNQPVDKKRGPLFATLAIGGIAASCCCLSTVGLAFLDEEVTTVSRATASGEIPTGDTPTLFPGSPGWLPSGKGSVFPDASVSAGSPQGLWWYPQVQQVGMVANVELYLPDGTYVMRPRPGGPYLFDLDGHRASGTTIGTFTREGDTITRAYERFSYTDPFTNGDDDEGPWFDVGAARRRPLAPVAAKQLVGVWKSAGANYEFKDDGTMTIGINNQVAVGQQVGTWKLDGYLIQLAPSTAPSWIAFIGSTGKGRYLVIGNRLYSKD